MIIRMAEPADEQAILDLIEPVIRAGDTYALPRDMDPRAALDYWTGHDRETFVADDGLRTVGTFYLRANQMGGGGHVANCGFVSSPAARGTGVGRQMCHFALERARNRGFRAMQFNLVVSTNRRAVALWESLGFEIVGRLPGAFHHPSAGYVDAFVMYQIL